MDNYWRKYLERYVNEPFHWYQPKGFTIKPENLPEIREKLRLLQEYEGEYWRKAQHAYVRRLQQTGLFIPTRANPTGADYTAIGRMNKEIFDSLGLAWVGTSSIVHITDVGEQFLQVPDQGLAELVEQQLLRYELPNPAVGRQFKDAGLFPYPIILDVLTAFPEGIPPKCYELFVSRIRSMDDLDWITEAIGRYMSLDEQQQTAIIDKLDRLPVVRGGRIVLTGGRRSLHHTVRLNRSYMLSFLKTPGVIVEENGRIKIDPAKRARATQLTRHHTRNHCYIEFANTEDWIAFFGQLGQEPTHEQRLIYHRSRGDVELADKAFREAKRKNKLPSELRSMAPARFKKQNVQEKLMEDFLVDNLNILEPGLKFKARQHPTPTGPLDILAQDQQKRWVVIELKKGRTGDKVVGQLLRYRGFIVDEKASGHSGRVRGFAVAPEHDRRLLASVRGASGLSLEVYEFLLRGIANRLHPN